MGKRLSGKLLAIVLTLAICATTVLGCLMTVSAEDSTVYAFGTHQFPSADDLSQVTLDVTLKAPDKLPNGFITGAFGIVENNKDADDCLVLEDVIIKNGESVFKDKDGNRLSDEDYVVFTLNEAVETVTFELLFNFSNGVASENKDYEVQLSDVELAYNDAQYFDTVDFIGSGTPAVYKISVACKHVITVVGEPLNTDPANDYSVYENSVCTICGEKFGYQLVPTAEKLGGDNAASAGTIDLLEYGDYLKDMGSTSTYYDTKVADNDETGADWEHAIIIDSAEEFVYLCKGDTTGYTAGKYFKVADGIAAFDLSGGRVDSTKSLEENLTAITDSGKNHAGSTPGFQGYFDGNGVTVYGAYINSGAYAGLFPCASGTVTIKNLNVKLCYFKATTAAGGLIGYYAGAGTGTLTVENCSVTDCYIESTSTGGYGHGIGAIYGYGHNYGSSLNGPIYVTNCFIKLDEQYFITADEAPDFVAPETNGIVHGGIGGYAVTNQGMVSDCIVLGVKPYSTYKSTGDNQHQHTNDPGRFQNVYTDAATGTVEVGGAIKTRNFTGKIFQLTDAQMKGSAAVVNMPNLEWQNTWVAGDNGEYPRLVNPGETFDTIYWDGTVEAPSKTENGVYIIENAKQLAYIASKAGKDVTTGNTYKIADNIDTIILQPYATVVAAGGVDKLINLSSAAEVKTFFTQDGITFKNWVIDSSLSYVFNGNFDGNGVEIYGLYGTGDHVGLFPFADGGKADQYKEDNVGITIENVALRNSYLDSTRRVGGIVGMTTGLAYGADVDGTVNVNNCEVSNNCIYGTCASSVDKYTASGVMVGSNTSEVIKISNALVYGNDAVYTNSTDGTKTNMALVPGGKDRFVRDANGAEDKNNRIMGGVTNSVILGTTPFAYSFSNNQCNCNAYAAVYTDADVQAFEEAAASAGVKVGYYSGHVTRVDPDDITGSAATTAMPDLTWGTDWYCGTSTGYPILAAFATTGVSDVSTSGLELVGTNVGYNDDGSLDFNFHFVPEQAGINPVLYVGTLDCSKFMKLEATASSKRDELGANALMFTIPNLSARDIDLVWLPTVVTTQGALVEWGMSAQLALADNAKAILEGDYDTADKNVAAALLNYGAAADAALSVNDIDYNAGDYDVFQGETALRIKYDQAGNEANDPDDSANWVLKVDGDGAPHRTWGYIDADIKLLDESKDNSEENPFIIESAEQLFYIVKIAGNVTKGKYYKVKDGITEFRLNPNITAATDFEKAKEILATDGTEWDSTASFQGHFDGNGVTISGLRTTTAHQYSGLFPQVKGNVTIKNVNITNSYMACYIYTGALVGTATYDITDTSNPLGSLTIENCSVTNCYMQSTGIAPWNTVQARSGVAAIVGKADFYYSATGYNGLTHIKNCYVNLDEDNFESACENTENADVLQKGLHGGLTLYNGSNQYKAENCIVIGVKPYTVWDTTNTANMVNHNNSQNNFSNVYTDQSITEGYSNANKQDYTGKMFKLTTEQLTGLNAKANMPSLDWDTVWTTTSGYPTFININYKAPASGRTIYYTGTATTIGAKALTEGTGEKDSPYIINTVEELAWVVTQTYDKTQGKYFKIADGITSIVLQKEAYVSDIMALSSAAETKAYFESNAANMVKWPNNSGSFCGHIDFNGATIYGIYQVSASYAGFFSFVDAGAVIDGLDIKNSYITSQSASANYNIGAISAVSNSVNNNDKTNGIIWLKNATVANNYIYNNYSPNGGDNTRSGVLFGSMNDAVYMDNILVYGNDAINGDGSEMPLAANIANAIDETAAVPEGLVTAFAGINSSGQNLHVNKLRNSIILGCDPYDLSQNSGYRFNDLTSCYENVYTDADIANDKFANGTAASGIKGATQVTDLAILKGDAATEVVNTFNTANGTGVWYVGAAGDYPGFKEAGAMPSNAQALYDGMVLDTADDYGDSTNTFGVYGTSLNLKVNPYMAFTFAFAGEYKQSENVVVTFKSGDTVIETVTAAQMVNNEDAGRFHLYRLKSAPVTALATGITVSVSYNGGAAVDFGTYSAEGFALLADNANKIEPCDYYATRYEAAKALLFYTDMLVARYGK